MKFSIKNFFSKCDQIRKELHGEGGGGGGLIHMEGLSIEEGGNTAFY